MCTLTETQPLRGARILVVEDNAVLAFDMVSLLRQAGAHVLGPAMTLKKAVALIEAESPSCAVLDVALRDGSVFPAAELLRDRQIAIVFYTGHGDPEILKREWPQAQVLLKPAPHDLLLKTVIAACWGLGFEVT
jgi:two-component system, response regulator PdtaR